MFIDPIVQEVREAREKIAAECDFDYHKILLRGEKILERYKNEFKVVTKEELDELRHRNSLPQERG